MASAPGGANECKLSPTANCTKDGASTYEPLLAKIFGSDLFTALNKITNIAAAMNVATCSAVDAKTHACTAAGSIDGIGLLAAAARAFVDPKVAASYGLTDSAKNVTAPRNDGTTNPQVTPLYLLVEALNEVDAAFAADLTASTADPDPMRLAEWRSARSQLVDELLGVQNANTPAKTASFADPALPKITPVLVDALRAQLLAHCGPATTTGKCTWARGNVATPMMPPPTSASPAAVPLWNETMEDPERADLRRRVGSRRDALRRDIATARAAQEDLLAYLADPANADALNQVEALGSLLSSSHDLLQNLNDAQNLLTPLYKVLATAFQPSKSLSVGAPDPGRVTPPGPSVLDATTSLHSRASRGTPSMATATRSARTSSTRTTW